MRKIAAFIIFLICLTIAFHGNFKTKGTFKELVIDDYISKSQSKEIGTVMIRNLVEDNSHRIESNDINIVNKVLDLINDLKVYEYRKGLPESPMDKYHLYFKNKKTYEQLDIIFMEDNYMLIRMKNIKSTKVDYDIVNKTIETRKYIKVIDREIDDEFINNIVNLIKQSGQ